MRSFADRGQAGVADNNVKRRVGTMCKPAFRFVASRRDDPLLITAEWQFAVHNPRHFPAIE
jgi:hypothetical protein